MNAHLKTGIAPLAVALASLAAGPALAQLTALGSVQLDQCAGAETCENGDFFGDALAAGDFDADGFADLAVGVPGETVGGFSGAGLVQIYYGSSSGLDATAGQVINQGTTDIPGVSEADDNFGAALAAGDLNGDGYDDLAIGVPFEDIDDKVDAGAVVVVLGSASGLDPSTAFSYDEDTLPIQQCIHESAEAGDRFGFALAYGSSATGDGRLVVGAPGEDGVFFGQSNIGGSVAIAFIVGASDRGQTCATDQSYFDACSGTDGLEEGDQLGWAVAYRNQKDSLPEEIVGVPFEETQAGVSNSGVVDTYANGCFQQYGALQGGEQTADRFGGAVLAGDFSGDGRQDLAIGIAGDAGEAGGVAIVFADSSDHLTTAGNQYFWQDSFSPLTSSASGNHFGSALAAGNFDGDGATDLAVGASDDDVSGQSAAGQVDVLYSSGLGLSAVNGQVFDQDHPAAIPSVSEATDLFGAALAAGDFDGNGVDDLAVGVPREDGTATDEGVVDVLYGLDRTTGAFGKVALSTSTITVSEGAPFIFFIAKRTGGAVLAASVDHARTGGTATPGVDFSYTGSTFNWGVGDLSNDNKVINLVDDTTDEPDETIVIQLSNPSPGLALGSPSKVTITIVDDDPAGQLFVDGFETGNTSKWSAAAP